VIDYHRSWEPPDEPGIPGNVGALHVNLGVPAQVGYQVGGAEDVVPAGRIAEVRQEVEAESAHAGCVQPADFRPRRRRIDQRNAPVPAAARGEGVEQHAVIRAIAG
jgi:hypothetical protein